MKNEIAVEPQLREFLNIQQIIMAANRHLVLIPNVSKMTESQDKAWNSKNWTRGSTKFRLVNTNIIKCKQTMDKYCG